jgi:hypothetical protein
MKTALTAARIGLLSACFAALAISGLAGPAEAGYVVTLTQEGSNVVATGSGTINLTDLTFAGPGESGGNLAPNISLITIGPPTVATGNLDLYTGFTGPMSFGSGFLTSATGGSGDLVTIVNEISLEDLLGVPASYISGSPLSDSSTYDNQTFASLGVTPGTYEWTWGGGANADSFTLTTTVVPEPSTWAMLLVGFGLLGFVAYRGQAGSRLAPS